MKTLLATDGSDQAQVALVAAERMLARHNNHFDAICIIPEFHPAVESRGSKKLEGSRADYESRMKAGAERLLESVGETLQADGITPGRIVELGSPADVLLERAEDYDVVVVGARDRNQRPGPGLGPVASRLLERATGTLLIGRELLNETSFRILLPLDGSAASENAIETLATDFRLTDADITLMHVVEKPWLHLDLEEEGLELSETAEDTELGDLFDGELRREADDIIEAARRTLAGRGAGTEELIVEGNPGREILRQAEVGEYDLVLLGATGVSDLKHTLLGSVSFRVASNAPCSVAVVR